MFYFEKQSLLHTEKSWKVISKAEIVLPTVVAVFIFLDVGTIW